MAGIFGIAVLAGVIAGPATAAMTAWAESEGGRVRLVALPADADGKISAALQIEPAPGWITYWREPGDSGIPPQISITPDSNVTLAGIAYPVPKHIEAGSLRDFGYDGPVAFPLDLTLASADAEPRFDAQVFIGLCKNICIPFQADFSLTLPKAAQSAAQEAMIIETARASLPEAPGADFAVTGSDLAADHTTLHLSLTLPEGGDLPEIIVTGPAGYVFTEQQNARREANTFSTDIVIPKLPKRFKAETARWGLLVKSGGRAMETTLAFE
ncbi:MAG: cytochrome C biogenesis protein [Rhizobium sp. 63-7]|nr:MAG: cytochrome C biogenesis protein [Rhizobium sp. 63-7]